MPGRDQINCVMRYFVGEAYQGTFDHFLKIKLSDQKKNMVSLLMRIIGKLCPADICQLSLSSKRINRGKLDEEDVREKT